MNLIRIAYNGRKVYRDKLTSNTWEPGDTNLVTADQASKLLRYAEFSNGDHQEAERAKEPAKRGKKELDQEVEAAMIKHQEAERAKEQEHQQKEAVLLTVESMDKGALDAYARKYEVELDKRRSVDTLRAEVTNLIEQFGAR